MLKKLVMLFRIATNSALSYYSHCMLLLFSPTFMEGAVSVVSIGEVWLCEANVSRVGTLSTSGMGCWSYASYVSSGTSPIIHCHGVHVHLSQNL